MKLSEENTYLLNKVLEDWLRKKRVLQEGQTIKIEFTIVSTPIVSVVQKDAPKEGEIDKRMDTLLSSGIDVLIKTMEESRVHYGTRAVTRAVNGLDRFNTVGQLVRRTEEEVLQVRNLGKTSFEVIALAVCKHDLRFGMTLPVGPIELLPLLKTPITKSVVYVDWFNSKSVDEGRFLDEIGSLGCFLAMSKNQRKNLFGGYYSALLARIEKSLTRYCLS